METWRTPREPRVFKRLSCKSLVRTGDLLRHTGAKTGAHDSLDPGLRGCNPIGSPENGGEIMSDYERFYRNTTTHGRAKRRIQMGLLQRFRENRWFLATRSRRPQLDYILPRRDDNDPYTAWGSANSSVDTLSPSRHPSLGRRTCDCGRRNRSRSAAGHK
jgi:hypothetical protein